MRSVYNSAGQLVQLREAVGTSVEVAEATYSYTPNGKREYVIDGEGNRARLVYDGHDRLSQEPGHRGPDRRHNRERNVGIDEEHSMRRRGQ